MLRTKDQMTPTLIRWMMMKMALCNKTYSKMIWTTMMKKMKKTMKLKLYSKNRRRNLKTHLTIRLQHLRLKLNHQRKEVEATLMIREKVVISFLMILIFQMNSTSIWMEMKMMKRMMNTCRCFNSSSNNNKTK